MMTQQSYEEKKIEALEQLDFKYQEEQQGFKFDEENHVYTLNGKRLHGITTILNVIAKPQLIPWASNMAVDHIQANVAYAIPGEDGGYWAIKPSTCDEARVAHTKKKESAGEAGTEVHETIEGLIKYAIEFNEGKLDTYMLRDDTVEQVKEFVQWAIVNDVKFLGSEVRLYSEKLWCAGTADFIAEIKGKLFAGDIKTSSAIYPTNFIQASAYAHMAREMFKKNKNDLVFPLALKKELDFHGVVIVNVPKRGGITVKENYDLRGNFQAFKAALTIHKFLNSQKVKKLKK